MDDRFRNGCEIHPDKTDRLHNRHSHSPSPPYPHFKSITISWGSMESPLVKGLHLQVLDVGSKLLDNAHSFMTQRNSRAKEVLIGTANTGVRD